MGTNKGLWAQLQELKPTKTEKLTLETFQKVLHDLVERENERFKTPPKYHIPAGDYPELSDEEFLAMVTHSDLIFIGGSEGVNKFLERYNRLTK